MKNATSPLAVHIGCIVVGLMFMLDGLGRLSSINVVTAGHLGSDGVIASMLPTVVLGAVELLAGLFFGLNLQRNISGLILTTVCVGIAFWFHGFWRVEPEFEFAEQVLFFKNLALAASLLAIRSSSPKKS